MAPLVSSVMPWDVLPVPLPVPVSVIAPSVVEITELAPATWMPWDELPPVALPFPTMVIGAAFAAVPVDVIAPAVSTLKPVSFAPVPPPAPVIEIAPLTDDTVPPLI